MSIEDIWIANVELIHLEFQIKILYHRNIWMMFYDYIVALYLWLEPLLFQCAHHVHRFIFVFPSRSEQRVEWNVSSFVLFLSFFATSQTKENKYEEGDYEWDGTLKSLLQSNVIAKVVMDKCYHIIYRFFSFQLYPLKHYLYCEGISKQ